MTRLLFVTNEHSNEALGIPVANKTAEILRKQGFEVIVYKIPFKDTYLNRVLSGEMHHTERRHFDTHVDISKVRQEVKPDLTVHFHCTPHNKYKPFKSSDFLVDRNTLAPDHSKEFVVELAAVYAPFPKPITKRLDEIALPHVRGTDILNEASSIPLSKQVGLESEKFARAIAPIIQKLANTKPANRFIDLYGKIRKKQVTKKPRLIKRR